MTDKQALPHTIYAFVLEGKRMWLPERVISDAVKYHKHPTEIPSQKPIDLEGVRDIFVMVQQEVISVGKAMQYIEAWLEGGLMDAFKRDGRA